jgi:hypothetical protein
MDVDNLSSYSQLQTMREDRGVLELPTIKARAQGPAAIE